MCSSCANILYLNVHSQKSRILNFLSQFVKKSCPLEGTFDFSQTSRHSLVSCGSSWGTREEAGLMGTKAESTNLEKLAKVMLR